MPVSPKYSFIQFYGLFLQDLSEVANFLPGRLGFPSCGFSFSLSVFMDISMEIE